MEKRKHYWNGSWGRLARRDILVYENGGQWILEVRVGGADGRSRWFEYDGEEAAQHRLRALLAEDESWRELP